MLIYSPRVGHILEHHLANLQRSFSKANLENLQIPTLSTVRIINNENLERLMKRVGRTSFS